MQRLKHSVLMLVVGHLLTGCASPSEDPFNGYAEREIAGETWFFPAFSHWTSLDLMPIEEYQTLVNGSHLIDMAPIYGYTSVLDGCKSGIVVSVVSKFSNAPQTEYDFVKKSPTVVNELLIARPDEKNIKVLYSVFSVRYQRKTTRVVLVHFKDTIFSFELRKLSSCAEVTDEELIEFVQKFISLNV